MNGDRARLAPGFGLSFDDLYDIEGLSRLDARFLAWLDERAPEAHQALRARRAGAPGGAAAAESELLIAIAACIDGFIAELFGIGDEVGALVERRHAAEGLVRTKWKFVKRQAVLGSRPEDLLGLDSAALRERLAAADAPPDDEDRFAQALARWQATARDGETAESRGQAGALLDLAKRYAAWAALTEDGRRRHGAGIVFRVPQPVDPEDLLGEVARIDRAGTPRLAARDAGLVARDGFRHTDPGIGTGRALDEARYCLACHRQGTDTCSRGMRSASAPDDGAPAFRHAANGAHLTGCPLDERISEFLWLARAGKPVGALAMITLDNPLVAATGHRICNDCTKACVFQQQTPVDIPAAETRTLRDVLELPWGFEIYSLLTRWNPLDFQRPVPARPSGRAVLVVGMGPAGFALAHHLLNAGHAVVGIDGLKIEPLPGAVGGIDAGGRRVPFHPIRDIATLTEPGERRVGGGFGGVAEYGITARWDKNFLTLVRVLLERRRTFALYGGVRFGGTVDTARAMALGFDHVALATGAGRPSIVEIPGALARGVRMASDFLMALHSTGAARRESLANLQVRLPVVVIGGGLTAIDTATEALAYYVVQVERYLHRHETLETLREPPAAEDPSDLETIATFLAHGRAIVRERELARSEGRTPRFGPLLRAWGGATIVYRRDVRLSQAYRLNHEEIGHALAEGVELADRLEPVAVEVDAAGAASGLRCRRADGQTDERIVCLPARSIFVAAGTLPNATVADEDPGFARDGRALAMQDESGAPVRAAPGQPKAPEPAFIVRRLPDGRAVTQFGDLHPGYAGSVVKALASAKHGHALIDRLLACRPPRSVDFDSMRMQLDRDWRAVVVAATRLAPRIVELAIHAPAAARAFRPGQFFRLQNFERQAPRVAIDGQPTALVMEALALTGAGASADTGIVTVIALETGGSADLCARLVPGTPVVLMGPTGAPTAFEPGETVVLVGGGLGNAVLFSIGAAMRAAGGRVLYLAGYRDAAQAFHRDAIEASADQVIWCTQDEPLLAPRRPQDRAWQGTVVDSLLRYASLPADRQTVPLAEVDRIVTIGPSAMMAAVAGACRSELAGAFRPGVELIASINSPMQCMMKAICAQCLQAHVDPATGVRRFVFSCANQDQPLLTADFASLQDRLAQNRVGEHQTARWLHACLARDHSPSV